MIKQQYIELFKLRGVEMKMGKETLAMCLERSGGVPTDEEKLIITENAMNFYIQENFNLRQEIIGAATQQALSNKHGWRKP